MIIDIIMIIIPIITIISIITITTTIIIIAPTIITIITAAGGGIAAKISPWTPSLTPLATSRERYWGVTAPHWGTASAASMHKK